MKIYVIHELYVWYGYAALAKIHQKPIIERIISQ